MCKTGIEPCEGFTPHGCGGLKRDRDEARHLACRMLTERNAAVEALGKDREDKPRALAAMKKTVAFTKRMIAERDKAQEHAEEMGDIVERALTKLEFEQVVDRWHRNMIDKLANERDAPKAMNDLQPCGHPRSAIVSIPDDLGGDPSHYCGMCNAEAEAEVRRDDRMNDQEPGESREMREEEVRY